MSAPNDVCQSLSGDSVDLVSEIVPCLTDSEYCVAATRSADHCYDLPCEPTPVDVCSVDPILTAVAELVSCDVQSCVDTHSGYVLGKSVDSAVNPHLDFVLLDPEDSVELHFDGHNAVDIYPRSSCEVDGKLFERPCGEFCSGSHYLEGCRIQLNPCVFFDECFNISSGTDSNPAYIFEGVRDGFSIVALISVIIIPPLGMQSLGRRWMRQY